jgi:hypothetical protein
MIEKSAAIHGHTITPCHSGVPEIELCRNGRPQHPTHNASASLHSQVFVIDTAMS